MTWITSSQNRIVKEIKSLKSRKGREDKGLYFIEGVRIIEEALTEKADISYIVVSESFKAGNRGNTLLNETGQTPFAYYSVPDALFRELADTKTPQGILAVIKIKPVDIKDIDLENELLVILDSVRDPGNMGTIIRTADAAGFTGVIAADGCVDVYNPKVLRSTMGSIFHIPVYDCQSTTDTIKYIKSGGIRIVASHTEGPYDLYETDLSSGAALVIGSEAEGISGDAAKLADLLVRIPMSGRAESLNASVAAGIMMYEVYRQRRNRR